MPIPLSCYVLTCNSERRLEQVLSALTGVVDELLIVDSGSTDATQEIAARFGARFIYRRFDDFASQRTFAAAQCEHDWILLIDSDEVLSPTLAEALKRWKQSFDETEAGAPDAFAFPREWFVLHKKVRCFYPLKCPDDQIRLFRKSRVLYNDSKSVHENMIGFTRVAFIDAPIFHFSCDSIDQMYGKMNLYTNLAALDIRKKGRPSRLKVFLMPRLIWFKWYVVNGGWRDGMVGLILARYAYDNVYQKYLKARLDYP